jgi:hypothetical protein
MKRNFGPALIVLLGLAALANAQVPADQDHPQPVNGNAFGDCPQCEKNCCVYGSIEYLYWWMQPGRISVPLVTVAPPTAAPATAGSLADPTTAIAVGNERLRLPPQSGGRTTIGFWLDDEQLCAIEGTYFAIAQSSETIPAGSSGAAGSNFLAVPFATPAGAESAFLLAAPGTVTGAATVTDTVFLQGAEVNSVGNMYFQETCQLYGLVGFRYLDLRDSLDFATFFQNGAGSAAPGGFAITQDSISVQNNFYGAQIGLRGLKQCGCLVFTGTVKAAFGDTHEMMKISGATSSNLAGGAVGATAISAGGIFTQPSNMAVYSRDRFCVVPQADVTIGYQMGSARIYVGYSFLYMSEVARPGEQIDRTVNFSQSPVFGGGALAGNARPAFNGFNGTDFWAHGATIGVAFNY